MFWEKKSIRTIARAINRSASSVSRELRRNFPSQHRVYSPRLAHERALEKRGSRGRRDRLKNSQIKEYVIKHLKQGWSPEQISGRAKLDKIGKISYEAIYQYVYARVSPATGLVYQNLEDLRPYLRLKRKRRSRKGLRSSQRCRYAKGRSIEERPKIVEKKIRVGDWEGDSMVSKDHKPGLNTLVERVSGLLCMTKLRNNKADGTAKAVTLRMSFLPKKVKYTLTLDNGPENSSWKIIESATGLDCFFANPYHSWERGANENANGLIREYFPKRTDFSMISEKDVRAVECLINSRPRKRLKYKTPLEVFSVALRS